MAKIFKDTPLDSDARLHNHRSERNVMELPEWSSLAQWKKERLSIRRHLRVCAGLNAQVAGFKARGRIVRKFEHEGIIVENICIETLPGFFMVGNLYRPKSAKGKLPLILHPHGHVPNARTSTNKLFSLPHRAMNSAFLGFAAFAYSMINFEDDAGTIGHRSLLQGTEKQLDNLFGLSIFGLQLNNSIKALDYLLSRSDIDPKRVGCTGESGGGTQTYFLAALDERVKVVAPVAMLSGHMQGGCVCENAPALHLRYSNLTYAGLIAPRPMLLLGCSGDWTHHLCERELPKMKQLYALYDRENAIEGIYQDENHNYNRFFREAVYAWMVRWLRDQGDNTPKLISESSKPIPSRLKLLVFDTALPPYKRAIGDKDSLFKMWQNLHKKPSDVKDVDNALQLEIPNKKDLIIRSQIPRYVYRKERKEWQYINYGLFSQDSMLSCRFIMPQKELGRSILLIKKYNSQADWLQKTDKMLKKLNPLINEGWGILAPKIFAQTGSEQEKAFRKNSESYLSSSYNKTEHQYQLDDIVTTSYMAKIELKLKPQSITLMAEEDFGLLAYVGWSWLRSKKMIDQIVIDLGGIDLRNPSTWMKKAYLPLLLGVGGMAGLACLSGGGKGFVSGVRPANKKLLPKGLRVTNACKSMQQLLKECSTKRKYTHSG